ncbi:3-deoxy-manno-octulosonate cytidylyltransferase [Alphaproteobacteria bacterium]|nr:3-deoxy-manno-octulosonate cytidylyltransferase [Alphaproteobacteria bacterium]
MIDTIIVIPVRLKASRFPNKPFAKIDNLPMLHYVYNAASKSFKNVFLAICDQEVEDYCNKNDLPFVITNPNHISGSDRIGEAVEKLEKKLSFDFIINVQGDMPFIKKEYILSLRQNLANYKMSTLACPFKNEVEAESLSKVKVEVVHHENFVAKDFSRTLVNISKLNKTIFHHIGVYGFQKQFLKDYVSQRPTKRELEEKLEQLRVTENTKISITVIDEEILGVDTKEDLDTVNQLIQDHG